MHRVMARGTGSRRHVEIGKPRAGPRGVREGGSCFGGQRTRVGVHTIPASRSFPQVALTSSRVVWALGLKRILGVNATTSESHTSVVLEASEHTEAEAVVWGEGWPSLVLVMPSSHYVVRSLR